MAGSASHILQSLGVNSAIATAKGIAAFFTGSGAMLAEAIHSASDCINQILLLVGVKQIQKPADEKHPLGYGRSMYFWSFIVALMLFTGGGVFSIYEGIHKILEPEAVENVFLGIGILTFSLILEGGATISNIKELNSRKKNKGFFQYLKETKDSDLVVVFGENSAAVLGLLLALIALILSYVTGDSRWDGVGSFLVGIILVLVAIFLGTEIKALLLGESADSEIAENANKLVEKYENIEKVLNVISVQQGPGEVMLAMKVKFKNIASDILIKDINNFEKDLKEKHPEIKWSFIEPDVLK
ncbi:MAG: cation diffusion facilitator family transporter [Candidatus Sericytochromatia bacterium]